MASFPGPKVHRTARRKLGRGQHVQVPPVTITAVVSTTTVTLTFSVAVIVSGKINYVTSTGGPVVSQTQTNPTTVVLVLTATQASAVWSIAANDPAISTFQGGGNAAAGGTF